MNPADDEWYMIVWSGENSSDTWLSCLSIELNRRHRPNWVYDDKDVYETFVDDKIENSADQHAAVNWIIFQDTRFV